MMGDSELSEETRGCCCCWDVDFSWRWTWWLHSSKLWLHV